MMFAMGPAPDQELLDSRPDDVSFEAAVGAWHAGYGDGRREQRFHVFPGDAADLQPFYADGFERGERDKLHLQRINERIPRGSDVATEAPEDSESLYSRVMDALERRETLHEHLLTNSELITAGAILLVAAAILVRGGD